MVIKHFSTAGALTTQNPQPPGLTQVSGPHQQLTQRRFCAVAGLAPLQQHMEQLLVEALQEKLSTSANGAVGDTIAVDG